LALVTQRLALALGALGSNLVKKTFWANPGENLEDVMLPNGNVMRGITIDNPSGTWLYVVSERAYVPPYTLGWATALQYSAASITVKSADGPSGQISTLQGDPWSLTLDEDETSASAGVPAPNKGFIENFTPVLYAATSIPQRLNISDVFVDIIQITGIANKRLRLLDWAVFLDGDWTSSIKASIFEGANTIDKTQLTESTISYSRTFVPGIDCTVGNGLTLRIFVGIGWHDTYAQGSLAYQII
jgi:hypothetical protein